MSSYSGYPIDYNSPRTIWTMSFQLLYTVLAMIPFYFYQLNILVIPSEGITVLVVLPIGVAILLFFMQIRLNHFYWVSEKTFKKRDVFHVGLKSLILTLSMFYTIFFLIFGNWVGSSDAHAQFGFTDPIEKLAIDATLTLIIILLTVIMIVSIQQDRINPRQVTKRIRGNR